MVSGDGWAGAWVGLTPPNFGGEGGVTNRIEGNVAGGAVNGLGIDSTGAVGAGGGGVGAKLGGAAMVGGGGMLDGIDVAPSGDG